MSKKETDLSYKLAELSDEYKRQGARFKRETEKTKVSQKFRERAGTITDRERSVSFH